MIAGIEKVYNGSTAIDKIYKGSELVYSSYVVSENSGYPLVLYNCVKGDLIDYKIDGNSIQRNIPEEYQQVEYIEFTDEQMIDTGVIPTSDTKLEIKIKINSLNCGIWASDSGSSLTTNFTGFVGSATGGNFRFGDKTIVPNLFLTDTYYIIEQSKEGLFINGENVGDYTGYSEFVSTTTLKIGLNTNYFDGKIYYCKIYDNDILVRNFIPSYRKSDNVIGIYDTVNEFFYTNAGSGTFSKGADVISPTPEMPIKIENLGEHSKNIINQELLLEKESITKEGNKFKFSTYSNSFFPSSTFGKQFIDNIKADTYYTISYTTSITSGTIQSASGSLRFNINGTTKIIISSGIGKKEGTFKLTQEEIDNFRYLIIYGSNSGDFYYENIQLEEGETATEYKPYNYIDVNNNRQSIITTIDLSGHQPLRKVNSNVDYIDYENQRIVRNIGKIDNYNGESITTEYISTTGELSIGATIYYVLETPIDEPIDIPTIQLEKGTNVLTANDEELDASNITAKYKSK